MTTPATPDDLDEEARRLAYSIRSRQAAGGARNLPAQRLKLLRLRYALALARAAEAEAEAEAQAA